MPEVLYRIDADDRLVEVNDGWTVFAEANHGEALTAANVLGRPLWGFMTDDMTKDLYRTMVGHVRGGGAAVRFNFRCDAPDQRRLLAMEITAATEGGVTFRTQSLHQEPRPSQALLDLRPEAKIGLLAVCSWCERVRLPTAEWVSAEMAMQWLGEYGGDPSPKLTHGMCPECYDTMIDSLGNPEPHAANPVTLGEIRRR